MHVLAYSIVHTQEPAPIPLGSKRAKISAAGDLTAAHARVGANSNANADVDARAPGRVSGGWYFSKLTCLIIQYVLL